MIVGRNQKFLSLCRLGLCSLARPTAVLTTSLKKCVQQPLNQVYATAGTFGQMFFISSFVPRSHSKLQIKETSKFDLKIVVFFVFKNWNLVRKSEFVLKTRSLFSKVSVCKSESLFKKVGAWKSEFDHTVVEPLYNVFENKPPNFAKQIPISENKFEFSTKQTPISKSNSDVLLLELPYLTWSPVCVLIHFVKNPAFCLHYHDRTHKNKQHDIEAWACRFSQTHHTLLIFNYKLT